MANAASPSGLGRVPMTSKSRSGSQGRRSTEVIGGIQEEEEEEDEEGDFVEGGEGILDNALIDEDEEDEKWEDTDQFGPELGSPTPVADPNLGLLAPPPALDSIGPDRTSSVGSGPLTHEALRKKDAQDEEKAASEKASSVGKAKNKSDVVAALD